MKIDTRIKYEEEYLPTKRHRIPRIREVEEPITVDLRELKKEDAPVAMIVTDYRSYIDENGKDTFGLRDTAFLAFEGLLYSEKRDMIGSLDEGPYSMEAFLKDLSREGDCTRSWGKKTRDDMLRNINEFIGSHVLIDGVIYEQKNEPRYVVQTFGLGHNHGGTALSITMRYNENIRRDNYFSALERDKAIAYADQVAAARGDTKYVGTFDKDIDIKVLMPEMVRCNPQVEHGEGNPFLNSLEVLSQGSDSVLESGLLVLGATCKEISGNKPSLDDQIKSAASRSAQTSSDNIIVQKETEPKR